MRGRKAIFFDRSGCDSNRNWPSQEWFGFITWWTSSKWFNQSCVGRLRYDGGLLRKLFFRKGFFRKGSWSQIFSAISMMLVSMVGNDLFVMISWTASDTRTAAISILLLTKVAGELLVNVNWFASGTCSLAILMVLHLGLLSNCFGSSIKGSLWTQSGLICSCARDLGLITVFMTSSVHLLFASGELSSGFTTRGDDLVALFRLISPWYYISPYTSVIFH